MFADGKVTAFGEIIGLVVAETKPLAQRAAKAVKVVYEDIHPSVITIQVKQMYSSVVWNMHCIVCQI